MNFLVVSQILRLRKDNFKDIYLQDNQISG